MKHTVHLNINEGAKLVYQILMVFGVLMILLGIGLAMVQLPLLFFSALGLLIFLATYFTVKEVNTQEVKLIIEGKGDELMVYRENSEGKQHAKTILRASELASLKVVSLNGSFGIAYYCLEAKTKAKGPLNHKIVKLLSPLLEASENDLLNILTVVQLEYPAIQLGH